MRKLEKVFVGLAIGAAVSLGMPFMAHAGTTTVQKAAYTDIDKTLAPIALYPDSLLGNVLIASTYPDQIVEANNWYQSNSDVPIDKISDLVKYKNWNESVVSLLVVTPDVINFMAENMDWTNDLAYIFTNKNDEMYTSIQKLRNNAYNAGSLKSTKDVNVVKEKEYIYITPSNPDVVVVPTYDPVVVYDYPGRQYYYTTSSDAAIVWGTLALATVALFCTSSWDWYNHHMWWGPGYGYYHYYDNYWRPWYDHPRHAPPPPPPPRPEPYHPKPQPHPPHHHHHSHRHEIRPDHHNGHGPGHANSSPIPADHLSGGYIHSSTRRSVNNGVVGGSSMHKNKNTGTIKSSQGPQANASRNTGNTPSRPSHHGSKIYNGKPNLPSPPKSQSGSGSSRIQPGNTKPQSGSSHIQPGSPKPQSGSGSSRIQPGNTRPQSGSGSSHIQPGSSKPQSGSSHIQPGSSKPQSGSSHIQPGSSKPKSAPSGSGGSINRTPTGRPANSGSHPTFDPSKLKGSSPTNRAVSSGLGNPSYNRPTSSGTGRTSPTSSGAYKPKTYSTSGSSSRWPGSNPSRSSMTSSPIRVQNEPLKTYNSTYSSKPKTDIFGSPHYSSSPRSSSSSVRTPSSPSYSSTPRSSGSSVRTSSSPSHSSTPRSSGSIMRTSNSAPSHTSAPRSSGSSMIRTPSTRHSTPSHGHRRR